MKANLFRKWDGCVRIPKNGTAFDKLLIFVTTPLRSMEKNSPKIIIIIYTDFVALCHFLFSFSEKMDGFIDDLFELKLFLDNIPTFNKN